jgi:hypothetical protein
MPQRDEQVPPGIAALGRLLEICVYAPLGAGVKLLDDAPGAVSRARQELSNARFIGRMVVSQGEARLRERMTEPASPDMPGDVQEASPGVGDAQDVPTAHIDTEPAQVEPDDVEPADIEPAATEHDAIEHDDELALPDYDHLPAIDIIDQLESLTADELARVERYERSNRRRRTVLGKIAQLNDPS